MRHELSEIMGLSLRLQKKFNDLFLTPNDRDLQYATLAAKNSLKHAAKLKELKNNKLHQLLE